MKQIKSRINSTRYSSPKTTEYKIEDMHFCDKRDGITLFFKNESANERMGIQFDTFNYNFGFNEGIKAAVKLIEKSASL